MPSFTLKDPASAQGAAPGKEQPEPEDPFARHARLLCEGKLMKELKRSKHSEPDRYNFFARIATEVARIEHEINAHEPSYTAKWRTRYRSPSNGIATLVGLFSPLGLLLAANKNEKIEFETPHRLGHAVGRHYWFRRLWTQLAAFATGVVTIFAGMAFLFTWLYVATDDYQQDISAWEVAGLGVLTVLAGYGFYKIQQIAIPKPLRMYAGGTFELVSLKREKTSTVPPLL
ncbi:MAG: hypothetical protein Q7Q73_15195 [Verrucomicrobiota bacterium JB024]|nr:hypothetical protein [Verrucomicrobiota bacterium JB024]